MMRVNAACVFGAIVALCLLSLYYSNHTLMQNATSVEARIAYVIPITQDGNFADGAAVLAESIRMNHGLDAKYDLVALVHESAESAVGKLKQIGYLPRIVPTPINESDIESEYYRSALKDSGCCGASELIKLEVFNMIEYEKVVMLDADMILLAPIHDLLRMDKTVLFAYDREMGGHCIQGGFFIVEPSTEYYDILIATVLQGDYRLGTGWGGKNIGWCYGGSTIQGLLSYFVNYLLHPTDGSMEVDSCRIDGMDISENNIGENCTKVNASTITLFHFTDCFKPWYCQEVTPNSNCANMVNAWWTIRYRLQNEHQIDNCINGQYTPLHQYTA